MHIALYHDALIPPQKYGGTERVLYWLAKGLVGLGHQVSLIAQAGSHIPGTRLIPFNRKENPFWENLIPPDVDLIHLWATPSPSLKLKKPLLVTIEGNGQPQERFHSNTVFVSRKHADLHGSHYFVHNGLDPSEFESDENRENYLIFLAKAS